MTDIQPISVPDRDAARQMHNQYTASGVSASQFGVWHEALPELLLGAYHEGEFVGFALGVRGEDSDIELRGIGVVESHRRNGIASALLGHLEENAAELGFETIGLGSAGGYVDEFYIANGYEPESILVRFDSGTVPAEYRTLGFEIRRERVDAGTRKFYVHVDEFDPGFLETVRDAFDDPEAIHIMTKTLD